MCVRKQSLHIPGMKWVVTELLSDRKNKNLVFQKLPYIVILQHEFFVSHEVQLYYKNNFILKFLSHNLKKFIIENLFYTTCEFLGNLHLISGDFQFEGCQIGEVH